MVMCKANQFYTVNETEGKQFSIVCHLKFGYYRGQVFPLKNMEYVAIMECLWYESSCHSP